MNRPAFPCFALAVALCACSNPQDPAPIAATAPAKSVQREGTDWQLATVSRAEASADPRHWVYAAISLRRLAATERQRRDGEPALFAPAELDAFDARAAELWRRALPGTDDELSLWLRATTCVDGDAGCDAEGALSRLVEVAGDNASVQVLALGRAAKSGDAVASRSALSDGARATRDSIYWMEGHALALEVHGDEPAPEQMRVQFEGRAADRAARELIGIMFSLTMGTPPYMSLLEACAADRLPAGDPQVRADCLAFARALVAAQNNLLGYSVGLRVLRRLLDGTSEEAAIVERLREREWLTAQHSLVPASAEVDSEELVQWIADWREGGELHALRQKLLRHDLALTPPPDWVPERPQALEP